MKQEFAHYFRWAFLFFSLCPSFADPTGDDFPWTGQPEFLFTAKTRLMRTVMYFDSTPDPKYHASNMGKLSSPIHFKPKKQEAMLNVGYWQPLDLRMFLAPLLPMLFLPIMALAAEYEVQSVSHRNHESMFFDPHFLAVEPGDSVAFVVADVDHQPQSVFVPAGADHWKAEKGKSITVNFKQQGVYIYDCAYHNVMGMAGVILVGKPVNLAEARLFFEQYKNSTFAMNQDRLDPVWTQNKQLR